MEWKKLLSDKRIRDLFKKPEPRKKDQRTEFERDYDRAIFCTPLRRLHDKAQVFPLEPNDSVRRRLTHSLEVSTVARDMGRAVGRWLEEEDILEKDQAEEQTRAIETIAATCGLIHDLGTPPFGHAGETAIREWFENKLKADKNFFKGLGQRVGPYVQDFLRFDSNAQTLRLISKLQVLSDLYGLNFTCATVSAACKYTVASDKVDNKYHDRSKPGYFSSENELVKLVRGETGIGCSRNPITFIVEACDDIVYSVVDLEDAVSKKIFGWEVLKDRLIKASVNSNPVLNECFVDAEKMIKKPGAVELEGKSRDEGMAQAFRVCAISVAVSAAITTFKDRYESVMEGKYHGELVEDSRAASLIKTCKDVGLEDVYRAEPNLRLEIMGRRIIHDLMDIFWEGAERDRNQTRFSEKIFSLMSRNYRIVFENAANSGLPEKYRCMQLVTDYISGMTDTFARELHKQLTNG